MSKRIERLHSARHAPRQALWHWERLIRYAYIMNNIALSNENTARWADREHSASFIIHNSATIVGTK